MWLVMCSSDDLSALWAYQGLKARGLAPLELVSAEMLACSRRWEHRLRTDGVSVDINLVDGRRIRGDTVCGALNRLFSVPSEHLHLVNPDDRDYATQEFAAFFMSWLHALPQPVLNRPAPQSLFGHWRHVSEWVWLASKAGLPTPSYGQSSRDQIDEMVIEKRLFPIGTIMKTVIVIGENVVGAPAPPDILKGCQRLADLAGAALLGIEFTTSSVDPWIFAGATLTPDLRLGGEALLDVLAFVLQGKSEENV